MKPVQYEYLTLTRSYYKHSDEEELLKHKAEEYWELVSVIAEKPDYPQKRYYFKRPYLTGLERMAYYERP